MRMFRSIILNLGLAFAAIAAFPVYAVEYVASVMHMTAVADFGTSRAKLDVDLAHHRKTRTAHADVVNSDLTRDGHGFRQASALANFIGEPTPREVAIC